MSWLRLLIYRPEHRATPSIDVIVKVGPIIEPSVTMFTPGEPIKCMLHVRVRGHLFGSLTSGDLLLLLHIAVEAHGV